MNNFPGRSTGAAAENQVVLLRLILRSGKTEVHILIMRRIRGEKRFAGVPVHKIGVLIFLQNEEIDIRAIVAGIGGDLLHERFVISVKVRRDGVRRDLEGKTRRGGERKRFVQNRL